MKSPKPTHEEFVFHIKKPSLSYHFGIEHDRRRQEWSPFDESLSVRFVSQCIGPDRFRGREGEVTLYPEDALVDHKLLDDDDVRRGSIGYIRATRSAFETVIYLPPSACWQLGEAMASGLICSMLTNGLIEARSMNRITSTSFHGVEFDPVAYYG